MNAPETLAPLREFKNHDLVGDVSKPGVRYEKRPAQQARRQRGPGPVQRLDLARQPGPVQLVHHRHGQGRDPGHARGSQRARRQLRGLHRRRRQGLLHRRQHQGVRRVLRRPSAGVPPVHAAVQRHGERDPRLRQAGDLPRQRHAHRRRTGDRHGLRLLGRAGPGALRPGRPQARLGADRRRDRLPAGGGRRRARDGRLRAVRAVLGAQGVPDGHPHRHRAGAEGRRQVRRQPAGRNPAPVRRVRPHRLRRAQDRGLRSKKARR